MTEAHRYSQAKRITIIGALVNMLLGIIKVLGGLFFHSHALVADGVHSFSDLFTDLMVLFASKYGSHDADDSHPYGHQRIETAATLLLSLFLILAGLGIVWHSINDLLHFDTLRPQWPSLLIISISIIANELLFHYTRYIGEHIKSPLIIANAWHHRTDAASSLVVLVGLIGSILGFTYLDAIAAVIVGIIIIKMGGSYGWNSVKELVDTAVEPSLLSQIEQVIQKVTGVKKIHQLRSRYMGNDILIDVHIQVSPKISVSEGHYVAQHVHKVLVETFDSVKDVFVHIDPEDDENEISCPSLHLPSRDFIKELLLDQLQIHYPQILFWNLHYINGSMSMDIACSPEFLHSQELHDAITSVLTPHIKEIRIFQLQEVIKSPS